MFRKSTLLLEWYDGECTSTTRFPIDGEIAWICLGESAMRRPQKRLELSRPSRDSCPMHSVILVGYRSIVPGIDELVEDCRWQIFHTFLVPRPKTCPAWNVSSLLSALGCVTHDISTRGQNGQPSGEFDFNDALELAGVVCTMPEESTGESPRRASARGVAVGQWNLPLVPNIWCSIFRFVLLQANA